MHILLQLCILYEDGVLAYAHFVTIMHPLRGWGIGLCTFCYNYASSTRMGFWLMHILLQ